MKKSTRIIAVFICILIALTLVSCGGAEKVNENGKEISATPTATPLPTAIPRATATPGPVFEQNSDVPEKKSYVIPKAEAAPVIDGEKDGAWDKALKISLDNKNTWNPLGSQGQCLGGTFYFLWSEDGLWMYAEINDDSMFKGQPEGGSGSYNCGDGVQLAIYPSEDAPGAEAGKMFFFSFCPSANDGKAYVGEHFVYGDTQNGQNVPESAIAAKTDDKGYKVEARIDAAVFEKVSPAIIIKEGTSFPMQNVILEVNRYGTQCIFNDTSWFNAPSANVYTLG